MAELERRDVLRRLALGAMGAAAVPVWVEKVVALAVDHAGHGRTLAAQGAAAWSPSALDTHQNETVIALSALIIPETETPGAKAARVNEFVDAVMADAAPAERDLFLSGLTWLDEKSHHLFAADFIGSTSEQQNALLTILASPINDAAADRPGIELFQAMKSLTITGYYTSEAAMASELGDDGSVFFAEYAGCTHPEHKQ